VRPPPQSQAAAGNDASAMHAIAAVAPPAFHRRSAGAEVRGLAADAGRTTTANPSHRGGGDGGADTASTPSGSAAAAPAERQRPPNDSAVRSDFVLATAPLPASRLRQPRRLERRGCYGPRMAAKWLFGGGVEEAHYHRGFVVYRSKAGPKPYRLLSGHELCEDSGWRPDRVVRFTSCSATPRQGPPIYRAVSARDTPCHLS
jgi:hypothetical protein